MASHFKIEEAREEDIPEIMQLVLPSFDHIPIEAMLGHIDTPEGRQFCGEHHLQAWRDHAKDYSMPCAIKCIHTDPKTGKQTLIAFAEWFIFDKPRSPEQYLQAHYLLSASWVPEENSFQKKCQGLMQPIVDKRVKWLGGRPSAVLMYMCVDKAWRRQGACTMCVQWGLDRCKELGIPAYLEASEEGEHVYKKLGFEEMEKVTMDFDGEEGTFPVMIWWPPGTNEEDKKPAVS